MFSVISTARVRTRDASRIANAQQLVKALELYAIDSGNYSLTGAGLTASSGVGFVGMTSTNDNAYQPTSIVAGLALRGSYSVSKLLDPIYGKNNYYLATCPGGSCGVYLKVEQPSLAIASSSLIAQCGGQDAVNAGMNYFVSAGGVGVAAAQAGVDGVSGGVASVPLPYVIITTASSSVASGSSTLVSWSSTGAVSCQTKKNGVLFSTTLASSSVPTGALAINTDFVLSCGGECLDRGAYF